MALKETINEELKKAMKSGDKIRLNTIRSIRALILEFEKSGGEKELSEEAEISMLTSAAKKRRDSFEQYKNAGRDDLADIEASELKILEEFLPAQLSQEDVQAEIEKIASEIGAESKKDFGRLMGMAMKSLKGKADGNIVRQTV